MIVNKYGNGGGSGSGVTPEQVQQEIQSALTPYWNSAATEEAISAATSGKADAANVTANNNKFYFPTWTSQGVINGISGGEFYLKNIKINGRDKNFACYDRAGDLPAIYAPTTSGNPGEFLVADGTNTPKWSAVTMPDTEEIELPIAAAVNKLKGDFETRLDQQYYKKKEVNDITARKVEAGQVDTQIKDYVDPAIAEVYETIEDKELPVSAAINELKQKISEISGFTPSANSPIIPAITTQAEYGAISGDVKTGDLIQVQGVVLDGYDGPQYGLFGAVVEEEEYEGVVRKLISWARRDNMNSVTWSGEDYPWMPQNDVQPIELPGNGFLISPDMTAEDEAYNGIGFDGDGKPVITHIAPEYDDETGEVTGITRTDTNMVSSTSVSTIWKGTQAEYDTITTKDPNTFYIIVNN